MSRGARRRFWICRRCGGLPSVPLSRVAALIAAPLVRAAVAAGRR